MKKQKKWVCILFGTNDYDENYILHPQMNQHRKQPNLFICPKEKRRKKWSTVKWSEYEVYTNWLELEYIFEIVYVNCEYTKELFSSKQLTGVKFAKISDSCRKERKNKE